MSLVPPLRLLREAMPAEASPLVLVHTISGDASVYAPLARRLSWPGAIVGVDALTPPSSLAELASAHIQALRSAFRAPWCLGGWAAGGVIAAEMAAQLRDAGEPVRFVAIFDARPPVPEMRKRAIDDVTLAGHFVDHIARVQGREPTRRPQSTEPSELLAVLRDCGANASWDAARVEARFPVFAALVRAFFQHEQRPVEVPVALFETQESHPKHPKPPTLGWENHAATIARTFIPGNHFTLLAEQHASQLAALVDEALATLGA